MCLTCRLVCVGVAQKSTTSTAGSGRGLMVRLTSTSEQVVFCLSDKRSHDVLNVLISAVSADAALWVNTVLTLDEVTSAVTSSVSFRMSDGLYLCWFDSGSYSFSLLCSPAAQLLSGCK